MLLQDKVVIVSGIGPGLGQELAVLAAREGAAAVVLAARTQANLDAVEADILALGLATQVVKVPTDIADRAQCEALAARALESCGRIDVLFNSAYDPGNFEPVAEADLDSWRRAMDVNFFGTMQLTQACVPAMIAAGGGAIVNMGSNSWWEAGGGFPIYATAKAAVHGLTRTMARDLGPHRIRVNTVVPGWIMTERQKALWVTPEALQRQRQRQCLPDLIEPVHVARMVVFLASDDAAMCTANNYMVEAGSI